MYLVEIYQSCFYSVSYNHPLYLSINLKYEVKINEKVLAFSNKNTVYIHPF